MQFYADDGRLGEKQIKGLDYTRPSLSSDAEIHRNNSKGNTKGTNLLQLSEFIEPLKKKNAIEETVDLAVGPTLLIKTSQCTLFDFWRSEARTSAVFENQSYGNVIDRLIWKSNSRPR